MCRSAAVDLNETACFRCGHLWWWPRDFDRKMRRGGESFFCPYCGQRQHYIVGKTKEQMLQEQLAAARADAEQMAACCSSLEERLRAKDKSIRGYKGVLGRMRKRLGHESKKTEKG